MNASCSIAFTGNWPPVIDWTDANGNKLKASATFFSPNRKVTSLLNVSLTGNPRELHLFICAVRFRSDDRPKQTTARNIPVLSIDICRLEIQEPG